MGNDKATSLPGTDAQTDQDPPLSILVAEDNVGLRRLIMKRLQREDFRVEAVENGEQAISRITAEPDVILLLDYKLPDMTGREVIERINQIGQKIPFIIITGHGDERTAVEMMKLGARDYLIKDHAFLEVLPEVMSHVSDQVKTEKKLHQVRRALQETEERFKVLFNSGTDAIFVRELDNGKPGHFIEVNDIACQQLGYSRKQLLQMTMEEIELGADENGQSHSQFMDKKHHLYETVFKTKSGEEIPVENNSHLIDLDGKKVILCISRDISQRKQLEHQLRQAQKMEAIGKLAGGIAHDFNNLLTAILGYSDLMLVKMDSGSAYKDGVNEIKKAAQRASALTQQLLAFSRKQILKPRVVNINNIVNGIEKMLKRLIGENVKLFSNLCKSISPIRADVGQLEQVILNLSLNASDAMPGGGDLTIRTELKVIDEQYSKALPYSRPGQFVCLSISDSGEGIDANTISHIFEPFFTTKKMGTGLGLSVVYGIIKQHNGWINVYSEPGIGTTIRVYFPALDRAEDKSDEERYSLADLAGNRERILLVEDEDGVRKISAKVLREYGYQVIEASDYNEALAKYHAEKEHIQLLLSDIVLKDKTGLNLVSELQGVSPDLNILLTSGYADQKAHWTEVVDKRLPFLQKPFSMIQLLKKVKDVLNDKKDNAGG